jgi:hypothetical protein
MTRKSNALIVKAASAVSQQAEDLPEMTAALQDVVTEIGTLLDDVATASVTAYWQIGKLITEVSGDPDKYLTEQQQAAHIDAGALVISIFAKAYSPEQLRGAVSFFDKYPSERQLNRLLNMRCPDNPRWRLSPSHIQVLSQVADDDQRTALEEKCAEEAYTANVLAKELQEIRGKRPGGGRKHKAPKGLKQQLDDLLQYMRKFIGRSEAIWLNEDSETLYDAIANTAPAKLDETVRGKIREIAEKFTELSDIVGTHIQMVNSVLEHIDEPESAEEAEETEEGEDDVSDAVRSAAAAAAAAGQRKAKTMTR